MLRREAAPGVSFRIVQTRLLEVNRQEVSLQAREGAEDILEAEEQLVTKVLRVRRMLLQAHLHALQRRIIALRQATAGAAVAATIAAAAVHAENVKGTDN